MKWTSPHHALPHRATHGMTLIEVLAALAILVLLTGVIFGFFSNMVLRRDQLALLASQQRDAAMFFDRLESALMTAVAAGPDGTAGVLGSKTDLKVVSRSVMPSVSGTAALFDAQSFAFAYDARSKRVKMTVGVGGDDVKPLSETAIDHVERVRIRYSDGRSWQQSFDSLARGVLPVAVEISIWFTPRQEKPHDTQSGVAGQGSGMVTNGQAQGRMPGKGVGDAFGPDDQTGMDPLGADVDDGMGQVWTPRQPDRVRVIVIPDAPSAPWREGSS